MPTADAVAMPRVPILPRRAVSLSATLLLCAAAVFLGAAAAAAGLLLGHVRLAPVLTTTSAGTSAASFVLRNLAGDECLGVAAHARDRQVLLQRCAPGSPSQDWHWGHASPDDKGFYQLVADGSTCLRLADDSTAPGTGVVARRCGGQSDADQYWQWAKGYPTCAKKSARYDLLVNLRAVESPTDAALVIGARAVGTVGEPIVLRQWVGSCNSEYWAQQER